MHFMITWDKKKTCLKYVSQQVKGFYNLNNDFHFCIVINSKPISQHRPTQSFIILPQEISVCSKKTDALCSASEWIWSIYPLTHALHTDRTNLSPFTKDFRVWGVLNETKWISLMSCPSRGMACSWRKGWTHWESGINLFHLWVMKGSDWIRIWFNQFDFFLPIRLLRI